MALIGMIAVMQNTFKMEDNLKKDLEKVVCDNFACLGRGERARCYLDIFKNCAYYENRENNYSKGDLKRYGKIQGVNQKNRG